MVSLRKAFERKLKIAELILSETNCTAKSKYSDVEIPDDIVECIDYGHADMTYEEFIKQMDQALEDEKDDY